ncbi:MAG: hypothetical protein HYV02_00870 [Deltaproteobacteria bacterium]|nr:hypothetical protein [Deltaproteobacteria bacterium]
MKSYQRWLFLLSCIAPSACGSGTEVLNPISSTYENTKYAFSIGLPDGWSVEEFTADNPTGASLYSDPIGTAETVVAFTKGETHLVILVDTLASGTTLSAYADLRAADGDETSTSSEDGIDMITVNRDSDTTNSWGINLVYASDGDLVLTLALEIIATSVDEAQQLADEFVAILGALSLL